MTAIDEGLLSPVSTGHDDLVSDRLFLNALVRAEGALVGAYARVGVAPPEVERDVDHVFGLDEKYRAVSKGFNVAEIAEAATGGGNPVIPMVSRIKDAVPAEARVWVHRGATSQDIWDTAIMMVARRATEQVRASLGDAAQRLRELAHAHRDDLAVARTLTQHAVPTTIGLHAATWARGLDRAITRLEALTFPAQLGGAGGTLASFVEITGSVDAAERLVAAYSGRAGLATPDAPWQVTRWPVTELGDALVQAVDAAGKLATDVATLSRTEIGEVVEGTGGGSSAMPQKQNPAEAVLIRSAALRAPQLGATLHLAAALAGDERPDGAWHAEWQTLRELLRLALGASWHASSLAAHLRVDVDAARRNLDLTGGLVLSERLSLVLTPLIGKERVTALVRDAAAGGDLATLVRALPEASTLDVDALLDPSGYTGLAGPLVDTLQEEK
ncbi:lyase family protein [Microbacterium horticulturae]|uniref:Lyase family protein n=1 Tax=Microbacterium horticulturae TaxID=3028316 RepID=A0ABY8C0P7_9MICO|nr:lyase family protein [Microbacterium sp. KACC 23027]WEG08428.1 lyase family protein [Microbacterium sp. KACC 23027]